MIDKPKRDTKKEDRTEKKKSKRDYRIDKIKALTNKALAVAKKRKWLVFLIGLGLVAYFVITKTSLGGGFLNTIKGLFGK